MNDTLMQPIFFCSPKRQLAVALALMLLLTAYSVPPTARAQGTIALPGSTSGNIQFPSSAQPRESENTLLSGKIEQGVDLLSLARNTTLNLFARVDYRWDTEELDFNRKILAAAGIKLRHVFSDSFVLSVGAKYENDQRYVVERSSAGTLLFSNWYGSWHLPDPDQGADSRSRPLGYPGESWGEIRYPGSQDPIEESSMVIEGYAEQGVDWARWGRWGTFNFYGNLDYIADTEEIEWNNMFAVGAGIRLKKRVGDQLLLRYGIEATREHYWETDETLDVVFAYLSWSAWWNPRVGGD